MFTTRLICEQAILFLCKIFFNSNIPLQIEKHSQEKLCKVLEMELKTSTLVEPKFEINFKALHYDQHDFIHQHPALCRDQTRMFKIFVIN